MNSDSNWVDCHVNSTIYLLFTCQLPSFLATSLHFSRCSEKQKREVQAIQALRKAGLALSKQGLQGRIEVAEGVRGV